MVATHYPIFDRGLYFARLAMERDLAVGAPMDEDKAPKHAYWRVRCLCPCCAICRDRRCVRCGDISAFAAADVRRGCAGLICGRTLEGNPVRLRGYCAVLCCHHGHRDVDNMYSIRSAPYGPGKRLLIVLGAHGGASILLPCCKPCFLFFVACSSLRSYCCDPVRPSQGRTTARGRSPTSRPASRSSRRG